MATVLKIVIIFADVIIFILFVKLGYYPSHLVTLWLISILIWMVLVIEKDKWDKVQASIDITVSLILLLAAFIPRIYKLGELPNSIWVDEARFGNLIETIIKDGTYLPFISAKAEQISEGAYFSPLFVYLEYLAKLLLGTGIMILRAVPALFGSLNSCIFYFLLREKFKRLTAFYCSLLFSFSYWNIVFSRITFEHTIYIFCVILSVWGLIRLERKKKNYLYILTVALGMGFSTYTAFRLLLVYFMGYLLFVFIRNRKLLPVRQYLFLLTGIMIWNMPIISFAIFHPYAFFGHAANLSIASIPVPFAIKLNEFGINLIKNIGMIFGFIGDPNLRHNPADSAMINPFVSLLFIAGFVISYKERKIIGNLIVGLLFFSILPATLSFEGFGGLNQPHAGRAIAALPVVYFLATYSIDFFIKKYKNKLPVYGIVIVFAVVCTVFDLSKYFGQKKSYQLSRAYDMSNTETAKLGLKYRQTGYQVYYPPEISKLPHTQYLLNDNFRIWNGTLEKLEVRSVLILNLYQDQELIRKEVLEKQAEWSTSPILIDSEGSGSPDIMVFLKS